MWVVSWHIVTGWRKWRPWQRELRADSQLDQSDLVGLACSGQTSKLWRSVKCWPWSIGAIIWEPSAEAMSERFRTFKYTLQRLKLSGFFLGQCWERAHSIRFKSLSCVAGSSQAWVITIVRLILGMKCHTEVSQGGQVRKLCCFQETLRHVKISWEVLSWAWRCPSKNLSWPRPWHENRLGRLAPPYFKGPCTILRAVCTSWKRTQENRHSYSLQPRLSYGDTTTYQQQTCLLSTLFQEHNNFTPPNPHYQFILDLQAWLQHLVHESHEVISALDANKSYNADKTHIPCPVDPFNNKPTIHNQDGVKLATLISCNLFDPLAQHHPTRPFPASHQCGTQCIDFILTTSGVWHSAISSGCLPFNSLFHSDHRPYYVYFHFSYLLIEVSTSKTLKQLPNI
jgi:hypothetical protein